MAREETDSDQIGQIASQLIGIGEAVGRISEQLKTSSVPSVRLHLATLTNTLIPQIQHWLEVAQLNANEDVRAYLRGVESRSAIQKRYDASRKLSAAKKPKVEVGQKSKRARKS